MLFNHPRMRERARLIGCFALGMIVTGLWSTIAHVRRYDAHVHSRLPPVATPVASTLEPVDSPNATTLQGKPRYRQLTFAHTPDGSSIAGLWSCEGPAKFQWRFDTDESVHILDGMVHVEHDGVERTFLPGHTAFFPAGAVTVWHVPERVKKSFVLSEPGRLVRLARRLPFWALSNSPDSS